METKLQIIWITLCKHLKPKVTHGSLKQVSISIAKKVFVGIYVDVPV